VPMPAADDRYYDEVYAELVVSGLICPDCASDIQFEVKRDMIILTSEGREAGRVAAVIVNRQDRQVTQILLSHGAEPPEYRLVPLALIEQVQEEKVLLRIFSQAVDGLVKWGGA
jgi:hypothetical protein